MSNTTGPGGKDSRKNPSRRVSGKKCDGGMIDVLAAYDTRYPDLHATKRGKSLPGNGAAPANPWGKRMARPRVGKGGPR